MAEQHFERCRSFQPES